MKMVIAGSKYDGPDLCRLKLHEEYGRVWLYVCDADGRSLQNGRLLCIEEDGKLNIHAPLKALYKGIGQVDTIYLQLPKLRPSSSEQPQPPAQSSQPNARLRIHPDLSSQVKTSPSQLPPEQYRELDQTSNPILRLRKPT